MNSHSDTETERREELEASTTRRPFQFSLRTLLLGVLAASVIFSLIACYRLMPARCQWSSSNSLSDSCSWSDNPPIYVFQIWGVGKHEPVAGYLLRIDTLDGSNDLPGKPPTRHESFGFAYVEDVRIDKSSDSFVLFVARDAGPLQKVYLDKQLAIEWFGRSSQNRKKINNFVACQEFWKKHVEPELERIERESAQSGE